MFWTEELAKVDLKLVRRESLSSRLDRGRKRLKLSELKLFAKVN